MICSYRHLCIMTAVSGPLLLGLCLAPQATAQNLFVTTNRTIAGGNPVSGSYKQITIGYDGISTAFPGVHADITGGSATDYINATNLSLVNIFGGAFGTAPVAGGGIAAALAVQGGSTVNLSGGSLNSFASVGNYGDTGPISTLNISGGTAVAVYAYDNTIVNMTGGTITAPSGSYIRGNLVNDRNGTINLSGGTVDGVQMAGVAYQPSDYGTINISGGAMGSILAGGNGFLNFQGSNLTVNAGAQYAKYDVSYEASSLVRDYTVTGTLSNGQAINQTFTAAADYTASSSLLNFRGTLTTFAPSLYAQTDQSVSGIYNFVEIGYDNSFSTPSSPNVSLLAGADVGSVEVDNDSHVQMTAGVVHGAFDAFGTSHLTMTGGSVGDPADAYSGVVGVENSTVSVSGGTATSVQGYDASQVTIGGTAQVGRANVDNDNFLIAGGSVQTVQIGDNNGNGTLSLLGGSVGTVEGFGGTANIHGGLAANAILANIGESLGYSGVDYNLYGTNLSVGNAMVGTYTTYDGYDLNGIWWDLSGTLENGSALSARYFDADGNTTAPAHLNLISSSAAAPEPGTLALAVTGLLPLAGVFLRQLGARQYQGTARLSRG